ncbi:MAG: CoA-binding protein [Deltaproteobacteria bacterium]|nr:CoA-binding protein [Deltaproteobacteria bacterium]
MGDYKKHFLHKFFHPESIAVVGATSNPNRLNHNLVANLLKLGYAGKIYPVHPSEGQILGLRTPLRKRFSKIASPRGSPESPLWLGGFQRPARRAGLFNPE